jgi:hypothetical protein
MDRACPYATVVARPVPHFEPGSSVVIVPLRASVWAPRPADTPGVPRWRYRISYCSRPGTVLMTSYRGRAPTSRQPSPRNALGQHSPDIAGRLLIRCGLDEPRLLGTGPALRRGPRITHLFRDSLAISTRFWVPWYSCRFPPARTAPGDFPGSRRFPGNCIQDANRWKDGGSVPCVRLSAID